jgi:tetratricopeptide (TPR) repeat protein
VKTRRASALWPRRLGLAAFGVLLAAVLVEAALRAGGFAVLTLQDRRNAEKARETGTYRIMCVGESTTQGQYPAALEKRLDDAGLGVRFAVVDRGLAGATSTVLVDRLEADLDAYRPDMVVAMMGINDAGRHVPYEPETASRWLRFARSLRTYKLLRLAWLGASIRARSSGGAPRADGRWDEAEAAYRRTLALDARDARAWTGLGRALQARGERPEAEAAFARALELDPRDARAYAGRAWGEWSRRRFAAAEADYRRALRLEPGNDGFYATLAALLRVRGRMREAEEADRRALALDPREHGDDVDGELSIDSAERGDAEAARAYHEKAEALRAAAFRPETARNYRRLKEILDRRGVRLVAVQYPMRGLAPLRKMLAGDDDGALYVDNERTFWDAAGRGSFSRYFADRFGGDFGHCTAEGNALLAEDIARVLRDDFARRGFARAATKGETR